MNTKKTNVMVHCTSDYDIFDMHQFNRPLHEDPTLEQSMKLHGCLRSHPIHVKKPPNGKLGVIGGHHRLHYAKRLGIPIYYIIETEDVQPDELETGKQNWKVSDFIEARARSGDKDCLFVLSWAKEIGIPNVVAASLLSGESASSNNAQKRIRHGTFKVVANRHKDDVANVVIRLRAIGVDHVASKIFLSAISSCLRVPEFNAAHFIQKVELYPANLRKRSTVVETIEEIESLYNYGAKASAKRIPLAFRAKEVGKERQESFGKKG